MMLSLHPSLLTAEQFRPFGDVIETAHNDYHLINNGQVRRYHDLATVETDADGGRTGISLFLAQPYTYPLRLREMERHPLASQAFIPLEPRPFLIVVAAAGEPPAPQALKAFISNGQQGVNYHRGVWHHMLLAIDQPATFAIIDRIGASPNCDIHPFDSDVGIQIELPSAIV